MRLTKKGINRSNYNIMDALPAISDFPAYFNTNSEIAVLIRVFPSVNFNNWGPWFWMALWAMRSHILNSDIQEHKVTCLFHIQESLFNVTKDVFHECGVPRDAILPYPDDLIVGQKRTHTLYYAASPFVDNRLDKFEYVIVLDADQFSLRSKSSAPFPLISMSINHLPTDDISLERGWRTGKQHQEDYLYWYQFCELGKAGFMQKAAEYCETTPEVIHDIMHPPNPEEDVHPGHCGAYIKIPMRLLRDNPGFRAHMRKSTAEFGHEEMALGVWYIKHFLNTGEKLPHHTSNFHNAAVINSDAGVLWDTELSRAAYYNDQPCLLHLYNYDNIIEYAAELATLFGASNAERDQFADNILRDVTPLLKQTK